MKNYEKYEFLQDEQYIPDTFPEIPMVPKTVPKNPKFYLPGPSLSEFVSLAGEVPNFDVSSFLQAVPCKLLLENEVFQFSGPEYEGKLKIKYAENKAYVILTQQTLQIFGGSQPNDIFLAQRFLENILKVHITRWGVLESEEITLPLVFTKYKVLTRVHHGYAKMYPFQDETVCVTLYRFPKVVFRFDFSQHREITVRTIAGGAWDSLQGAWVEMKRLLQLAM
jgi:hypothetical protein